MENNHLEDQIDLEDQQPQSDEDEDVEEINEPVDEDEYEDVDSVSLTREAYELLIQKAKKADKLQKQKKQAIIKRTQQVHTSKQTIDTDDIESKVEKMLKEKEDLQRLSAEYPDLDTQKIKTFAKSKWLSIQEAFGALNFQKKPPVSSLSWVWTSWSTKQSNDSYQSKDYSDYVARIKAKAWK